MTPETGSTGHTHRPGSGGYLVIDAVAREADRCRDSGRRSASVRLLLGIDWESDGPRAPAPPPDAAGTNADQLPDIHAP